MGKFKETIVKAKEKVVDFWDENGETITYYALGAGLATVCAFYGVIIGKEAGKREAFEAVSKAFDEGKGITLFPINNGK